MLFIFFYLLFSINIQANYINFISDDLIKIHVEDACNSKSIYINQLPTDFDISKARCSISQLYSKTKIPLLYGGNNKLNWISINFLEQIYLPLKKQLKKNPDTDLKPIKLKINQDFFKFDIVQDVWQRTMKKLEINNYASWKKNQDAEEYITSMTESFIERINDEVNISELDFKVFKNLINNPNRTNKAIFELLISVKWQSFFIAQNITQIYHDKASPQKLDMFVNLELKLIPLVVSYLENNKLKDFSVIITNKELQKFRTTYLDKLPNIKNNEQYMNIKYKLYNFYGFGSLKKANEHLKIID